LRGNRSTGNSRYRAPSSSAASPRAVDSADRWDAVPNRIARIHQESFKSFRVVRSLPQSSGIRLESSGIRPESAEVAQSRLEPFVVIRSSPESSGVVRSRLESSGVLLKSSGIRSESADYVQSRSESSGVVWSRPESSGVSGVVWSLQSRPGSFKAVRSRPESSEISENKIGIKLCIKKASDATVQPKKPIRKRARKPRSLNEDSSDETSPEKRNRRAEKPRPKKTNNNTEKRSAEEAYTPPKDQSVWANGLPESVLYTIFKNAVQEEGCLPTLIRLSEVCTAWYKVSQQCSLWRTVDLGTWGRDRFKTEPRLKWLIENRLQHATEVGLANWKVTNVQCVLDKLLEAAPGLTTISLAGWKALSTDH
uniref:F-box domain-containing protein n=1 Tax=Anopheles melas TaxID=34690 RepID=A0A182U774_9DIPT